MAATQAITSSGVWSTSARRAVGMLTDAPSIHTYGAVARAVRRRQPARRCATLAGRYTRLDAAPQYNSRTVRSPRRPAIPSAFDDP